MFTKQMILLVLYLVCASQCATINNSKDAIGFPEAEEDASQKNKENRQPVYIPAMCSPSELYYPGDQKDDWICDCRPAFLYHPMTDNCWPAFQKGPCKDGEYLILPQDSVIPICVKNPCNVDTYVLWNGKCERLGSTTPCDHLFPVVSALGVNATTLVVSCVRLNNETKLASITAPSADLSCAPGCKRSVHGRCTAITF